ncbi:MAG: hypothetical protein ACI8UO_006001 [Verrucomicrobiales bacterium]|jgi:hypothetical protein
MKQYWKIGLALAIIFIAGGGFGFTVGKGVDTEKQKEQMKKPEGWMATMEMRMIKGLDLTDEQIEEVRPALRETAQQLYFVRRKATREQALAIRDFYVEIEPVLGDEQRVRLQNSLKRIKQRVEQLQKQVRENGRVPSPVIR